MLNQPQWRMDAALRLGLGLVVCFCVSAIVSLLVQGNVEEDAPPKIMGMVGSTVLFQGGIIVLTWQFLHAHGLTWATAFGLTHSPWRSVGFALLVVIFALPFVGALKHFCDLYLERWGLPNEEQLALTALRNSATAPEIFGMGMMTIVFAPIAEEVLFRGLIYSFLKQVGRPPMAFWATSLLFGLIHFNLGAFLPLSLLGAVFLGLYLWTRNLLAPIAAHIAFNSINFIWFLVTDATEKPH